MAEEEKGKKSIVSEIEVAAGDLFKKIKDLVKEGNIRRLIIKKENGDKLLDISLTSGVVVAGGLIFFAPAIAAIAAVAGLLTRVKIEIVKTENEDKK